MNIVLGIIIIIIIIAIIIITVVYLFADVGREGGVCTRMRKSSRRPLANPEQTRAGIRSADDHHWPRSHPHRPGHRTQESRRRLRRFPASSRQFVPLPPFGASAAVPRGNCSLGGGHGSRGGHVVSRSPGQARVRDPFREGRSTVRADGDAKTEAVIS